MKENEKLKDNEFDELIEIYKDYVEEETNRRIRRVSIFWSSISIFYIHSDLHLNIATTAEGVQGIATPWGIPVAGITEEKFLVLLFILTLYFMIKFLFFVLKAHRKSNIYIIFRHFYSVGDDTKSFHTGGGSYFDLKYQRTFEKSIPSVVLGEPTTEQSANDDYSDSKLRQRYDTWLFMYHYRFVGFLEYFFAPIIFPASVGLWALIQLAAQVYF